MLSLIVGLRICDFVSCTLFFVFFSSNIVSRILIEIEGYLHKTCILSVTISNPSPLNRKKVVGHFTEHSAFPQNRIRSR